MVVEENRDFLLAMKSRFEHVKSTCSHTSSVSKAYKLSAAVTASHSYWCSNMKIIYCPTFKSALLLYMYNMLPVLISCSSCKYNNFMNDRVTKFVPSFEFTSSIFVDYRVCWKKITLRNLCLTFM